MSNYMLIVTHKAADCY